ncbi:MAG: hypothetical protein JJ892_11275 [Balneola sp.]|nr:hypothetical protein [Balneola sp.]MBO6650568.1 hypothetical protein [Balneola sp.]MBO6712653.1 hypothetical protein [Balneola sp.]MBO6800853.1 hypothetical protein [Balneola sp.]MBO6870526.1 hypothetical protein [Balneola sp.]
MKTLRINFKFLSIVAVTALLVQGFTSNDSEELSRLDRIKIKIEQANKPVEKTSPYPLISEIGKQTNASALSLETEGELQSLASNF